MQTFEDDDKPYLKWTGTHPKGFVLNVPRTGMAPHAVVHSAQCVHITSAAHGPFVGESYYKVCSMDEAELAVWFKKQFFGKGLYHPCGHCKPAASLPPAPMTHTPTDSAAIQMTTTPRTPKEAGVADERPTSARLSAVNGWPLWTRGAVLQTLNDIEPRLACWETKTHPQQIALQKYLDDLMSALTPFLSGGTDLFLHLDVGLPPSKPLLQGNDLENYLTPLFSGKHLDPAQFRLVSATKQTCDRSRLVIGRAMPPTRDVDDAVWSHFACRTLIGEKGANWKGDLRDQLVLAKPHVAPPGEVDVEIVWRCEAKTALKWSGWWKPTGDTMGPVLDKLGEPPPNKMFNPSDDRIVSLALHLLTNPSMGKAVDVGMGWRPHHKAIS